MVAVEQITDPYLLVRATEDEVLPGAPLSSPLAASLVGRVHAPPPALTSARIALPERDTYWARSRRPMRRRASPRVSRRPLGFGSRLRDAGGRWPSRPRRQRHNSGSKRKCCSSWSDVPYRWANWAQKPNVSPHASTTAL